MQLWLDVTGVDTADLGQPDHSAELAETTEFDRVWQGQSDDCIEVTIDTGGDQAAARQLMGMTEWLVIRCADWTMIPLENLVASAAGTGTRIVAALTDESDIRGAAFALERGVDALLLPPPLDTVAGDDLWRTARLVAAERRARDGEVSAEAGRAAGMTDATIVAVEDGGVGDRVCVDLTSTLEVGEGLLIGSSSQALCLVHGETIQNEHVPTRPFRVNAGAVHAYALMANGSTKYLCELEAGDEIAVADESDLLRSAIIGRLKIERRPFLLIRFEIAPAATPGQLFAQQAETVRVVTPEGEAKSVTDLQPGDVIRVRTEGSARHMGGTVFASLKER